MGQKLKSKIKGQGLIKDKKKKKIQRKYKMSKKANEDISLKTSPRESPKAKSQRERGVES